MHYTYKQFVSNASPIIALTPINKLDLLEKLFSWVLVPPAVVCEVSPTVVLPSWIIERALMQPLVHRFLILLLDRGKAKP